MSLNRNSNNNNFSDEYHKKKRMGYNLDDDNERRYDRNIGGLAYHDEEHDDFDCWDHGNCCRECRKTVCCCRGKRGATGHTGTTGATEPFPL